MLRLQETITPATLTRWRGGIEIFQTVAPAAVIVRTETGHGTGFVIDANGLVVTNHHVVASGLKHDPVKDASFAMIHMGRLATDGTMSLVQGDAVRAYLYKDDPTRDLAFLRIAQTAGVSLPPHLTLADNAPRPGQDCAIVGHPSSGMLWTMRPCQVAAVGQMPSDLVNVVMLKLAGAQQADVEQQLKRLPSRRIIITSANANPGDSGGPVVDSQGRVIAVTFGGPGRAEESKFTYHVHLDELKAAVSDLPKQPMYLLPNAWAFGPRVELRDLDGDGRPDVLLAGGEMAETMLFDLRNSTPAALLTKDGLSDLVAGKKWQFDLGITTNEGRPSAFYDTDSDGTIDLILTGAVQNGNVDGRFVRGPDGRWKYESGLKVPILSGQYFKNPMLAARAERVIQAIRDGR
jgi:S1-C subfamily serine protease